MNDQAKDMLRRAKGLQDELDAMGVGRPAAAEPTAGVTLEAVPAGPRFVRIRGVIVNLEQITYAEKCEGSGWWIYLTNGRIVDVSDPAQAERLLALMAPEVI